MAACSSSSASISRAISARPAASSDLTWAMSAAEAALVVDSVMPPTEMARPDSVRRRYAAQPRRRDVRGKHVCGEM